MVLQLNEAGELVETKSKNKNHKKEEQKTEIVDARGNPCDLHTLIAAGDATNALELIAAGYDIHARDVDGWTPLHHAAYVGLKDVVKVLLDENADVTAKDKGIEEWTEQLIDRNL